MLFHYLRPRRTYIRHYTGPVVRNHTGNGAKVLGVIIVLAFFGGAIVALLAAAAVVVVGAFLLAGVLRLGQTFWRQRRQIRPALKVEISALPRHSRRCGCVLAHTALVTGGIFLAVMVITIIAGTLLS